MSKRTSIKMLYINSADRIRGGTASDFTIKLSEPLHFNPQKRYRVYVDKAEIPLTFYSIDSRNNTFQLVESEFGTTKTIVLADGFYQENNFISELQSKLRAASDRSGSDQYTVTYSDITGKITITANVSNSTDIIVPTENSAGYIFGFVNSGTYTFTNSIDSPNVANFLTIYEKIYIRSSLSTESYDTAINGYSDILEKVQLPRRTYDLQNVIYWHRDYGTAHCELLDNSPINAISFRLTDIRNRTLDLQGHEWNISLVFEEIVNEDILKNSLGELNMCLENVKKIVDLSINDGRRKLKV